MPRNILNLPKGTILPDHIAIILDGNRRWARARGINPTDGHKAGYKALNETVKAIRGIGVHTLTVWGFSTENWDRPGPEIKRIMALIKYALEEAKKEANEQGVRIVHLGRKDRLPKEIAELIVKVEEQTLRNKKYIFNIALDYGGRDEIIRAIKRLVADGVPEEEIDEKLFSTYLDTGDQPYPNVDLFIRTSGEQRTSGFLPWQLNYAEYYWERDHLPDMTKEKLRDILLDYSRRRRRFGGNDKAEHLRFKPELTAKLEVAWWRLSKIPEGTRFVDYAMEHLKEQYGLSKEHAGYAAKYMLEAVNEGNLEKWKKAQKALGKFYAVIREEVKLAFEPSLVASLDLKLMQSLKNGSHPEASEIEATTRNLVSEMYRISEFQAAKAAHLRALATVERTLAEQGKGEHHWAQAEEYLEMYYRALKDRVA